MPLSKESQRQVEIGHMIRAPRHYHATECIFDHIAACGPQELYALYANCSTQCTTMSFDETLPIGAHHNATNGAIHTLAKAGIIDVDDGAYDLTDYGYELVAGHSERQREYEAYKRAHSNFDSMGTGAFDVPNPYLSGSSQWAVYRETLAICIRG